VDQVLATGATVTLVHLVAQVNGCWQIACMPNLQQSEFGTTLHHPCIMHTNEPRAVTCPQCLKTVKK
jgi:hypothetical protein